MASPKTRKVTSLATAALAATAVPAVAQAATAAHADRARTAANVPLVTWKNNKSGRYLTVHDGSTANGAEITTNSTATQAQQHWYSSSGTNQHNVVNENSAKCLTVIGPTSSGALDIDQWACSGSPGGSVDPYWAKLSAVNKSYHFIGYALYAVLRGPSSIIACEKQSTHSVYAGKHFGIGAGGVITSAPKSCVWTRG